MTWQCTMWPGTDRLKEQSGARRSGVLKCGACVVYLGIRKILLSFKDTYYYRWSFSEILLWTIRREFSICSFKSMHKIITLSIELHAWIKNMLTSPILKHGKDVSSKKRHCWKGGVQTANKCKYLKHSTNQCLLNRLWVRHFYYFSFSRQNIVENTLDLYKITNFFIVFLTPVYLFHMVYGRGGGVCIVVIFTSTL